MRALKNKNNKTTICRDQLLKIAAKYYEDLYASKVIIPYKGARLDTSEIPDITVDEITFALNNMKLRKAPGKDNITTDLLVTTGATVHKALAQLFTQLTVLFFGLSSSWLVELYGLHQVTSGGGGSNEPNLLFNRRGYIDHIQLGGVGYIDRTPPYMIRIFV